MLSRCFKEKDKSYDIYLICHGRQAEAFQHFLSLFQQAETAGGVVFDQLKRVLFIYRNGKWDLPKGHIDPGETREQCALREVEEETGLKGLQLAQPLTVSWHMYVLRGAYYIKKNNWYLMRADSNQDLLPEQDEGISNARWVKISEVNKYLSASYRSINESISPVLDGLGDIS